MQITNEHNRHCILFALGRCQAYGDNAIRLTRIKEWFSKFKKGELKLEDKQIIIIGRPKKTAADDLQALLDEDDSQSTR